MDNGGLFFWMRQLIIVTKGGHFLTYRTCGPGPIADSLRDRADNLEQKRTLPDVLADLVLADLVQLRRILYEKELTILNNGGHFLTYLRTWYCMIAADSLRDSADGLEQ